jgi:mRNA interferase ChpB
MVKRRSIFERGDIVKVCLNPTVGHEQQGEYRPCLVLSTGAFNQLGNVLIAPITQGGNFSRFKGFAVPLNGIGIDTQGVVLANGIRSVDLVARKAKIIETVPDFIVDEVVAKIQAILGN